MDWDNPLRSIAPTVDTDVLQVLGRTHASVTGNQLAKLAGRSYAQVHAVLGRLVSEGIVQMDQHGRTFSYLLNRDHIVADGLLRILDAASLVEEEITRAAATWSPSARTVALFGSAARRGASADSDIDVLVIRLDEVRDDDPPWTEQVGELARRLEQITGNRVQLVELSESELEEAVRSAQPLVHSLRHGAQTLFGDDLRTLITLPGGSSDG